MIEINVFFFTLTFLFRGGFSLGKVRISTHLQTNVAIMLSYCHYFMSVYTISNFLLTFVVFYRIFDTLFNSVLLFRFVQFTV